MRIDAGIVLAIIIEFLLFIYYADTLFYRKFGKRICCLIIAAGYLFHFLTCAAGNIVLNICVSMAMYMIFFLLCYHVSVKTAVFQSLMLVILMLADEFIVIATPVFNMSIEPELLSEQQSFVLTITSRLLLLIEIMCITRFYGGKQGLQRSVSYAIMLIPFISILIIVLLFPLNARQLPVIVGLIALLNLLLFAVDQKIFRNEMENDALKESVEREKIMYEEYTLLNEQYEQMRAFRHDIKEHLGVLNSLIDENSQEAKEYIRDICETEESIPFSKFSNNKMLNILLSKKKNECKLKGVDFYIDPIRADLSFLQDMDVVTVFSNLINNALDSCEKSVEKKIFLNISTTNECFTVIKIENSCDIKPIVINAKLKTTKADESMHGIGMNNIRKALKKYNGLLQWDYSEERKIFSVTILINILKI